MIAPATATINPTVKMVWLLMFLKREQQILSHFSNKSFTDFLVKNFIWALFKKMDFNQYLRSRKPIVVKNPKIRENFGYNEFLGALPQPPSYQMLYGPYVNSDATLAPNPTIDYAKPNLQVDAEKARREENLMIIPPLNTGTAFSQELPQYVPAQPTMIRLSSVGQCHPLPESPPSEIPIEVLKAFGYEYLPSAKYIFKPEYAHTLSSKKKPTFEGFRTDDANAPELVIPPLNTDVRFPNFLPDFVGEVENGSHSRVFVNEHGVFQAGSHDHASGELHIHENFSWTIPSDHDSEHSFKKKALISPVMDQQACGSCWAFAVATTMSDCLVVGEAVDWSPYISPTFCMACYPQGKCNGGMPATLALDIEQKGVADQSCLDYSWCDNNSKCNIRDSSQHFKIDSAALSRMIPDCGCMFQNDKYIYSLDKGTDTISVTPERPLEMYRKLVKFHILDFGPVIGGYLVLNNFLNGKFTQSNEGVYFDRADYANIKSDGTIPFSDSVKSSFNSAGLHAVSIVGWGLAKNIQYDTDKRGDVPFWYCRNSWGTKWGDEGFFKMAMYPFNQTAQFDKVVSVSVGRQTARIGGLMLIRATKPPVIKSMKEIGSRYKSAITLSEPNEFYNRDAKAGKGIIDGKSKEADDGWLCNIL